MMRELMKHLHKYVKLNFNIPLNSKQNCRKILKEVKRKLGHRVPIKKRIGIIKSFLSRNYNLYHIRQSRNLRFSKFRPIRVQPRFQPSQCFRFQSRLQFEFLPNYWYYPQPRFITTQSQSVISDSENQLGLLGLQEQKQWKIRKQRKQRKQRNLKIDNVMDFLQNHFDNRIRGNRFEKMVTYLMNCEYKQDYSKILWHNTEGADGGIDIFLFLKEKNERGQFWDFIQCKNYSRNSKIGVSTVREYCGITGTHNGVRDVYIITLNEFTEPAITFADRFNNSPKNETNIILESRKYIIDLIKKHINIIDIDKIENGYNIPKTNRRIDNIGDNRMERYFKKIVQKYQ